MDKKKFAELLYNTVISENINQIEMNERYKPLIEFVNTNFPKTLYRYRTCEKRNIEAFYRNQIWASNGECMKDGFDTHIFFNRFSVEKQIKESLSDEALAQLLPFIKFENLPFLATYSKFDEPSLYKSLIQFREIIK
ncbi:MAG: hypothetical protein K2G63_04285, partial [Oscillospiraceae bacterium]|nr:hypothetical protein [Oscillospiraceae bacterium]